ncbi:unnamed protein product [Durusdinium trenchii]|uniref:Uncharacterized protein n=1 Tax=Durusdinium trenchii TaxID=1381693 RepID=A0ABP0PRH7_9DINO
MAEFTCLVGAGAFIAGWLGHRWLGGWQKETRKAMAGPVILPASTFAEPEPLHQSLCKHVHGTSTGPYCHFSCGLKEDHSYPHTNIPTEVLRDLFQRLRPMFLVEVGSFKGGSSIRMVSALRAADPESQPSKPCLVCIDTFLGDAAMWLNKQATGRSSLLLKDGCPQLYQQFMVNTRKYADVIVPFPIASLCGLRALQQLAAEGTTPLVDFLYLDSAHLKGETKLEITEAFRLVRPGGVLLGDDLDWPAVEADLSSFLTEHGVGASQSADDDLFHGLCGTFFFAAGGFWVVDAQPRQWLLRKPPWAPGRDALKAEVRAAEMGDTPTEFVPATMEDQEALALYQQGIAKLETGDTAEGSRLLKIEVRICYGEESAAELLAVHGMVLPKNEADYLEVFESVEDLVAAVESICGAPRRDRLARLEVIPVDDLLVRPGRLEASEPLLRALQAMLCEDDELCDPGERRLRLVCSEERQQSLRLEALLLLAQILRGALRVIQDMPDAGSPDLAVRYRRHVAEMLNQFVGEANDASSAGVLKRLFRRKRRCCVGETVIT